MAARLLIVVYPSPSLSLIRYEHSPNSNCKYISFTGTEDPTRPFLHKKYRLLDGQHCFATQAIEHPFRELPDAGK
jgi:hypothetical protein